jgi:hypothetical protein
LYYTLILQALVNMIISGLLSHKFPSSRTGGKKGNVKQPTFTGYHRLSLLLEKVNISGGFVLLLYNYVTYCLNQVEKEVSREEKEVLDESGGG